MNINDNVLALCELSNDLFFHKIPCERYLYYIENSLKAGINAAKGLEGADIYELYRQKGITIEYCEKPSSHYGVILRGQVTMDKKGAKVTLYSTSISELASNSAYLDEESINYETALKIHLAHEFYHFLEFEADNSIAKILDPIEIMKIPFFTRRVCINRTSEIAAHSFTKEILGLSYIPNIYDYIYLINSGKMSQHSFEKKITNLNKTYF